MSNTIHISRTINIDVSVRELAEVFAMLSSDEQAGFFAVVHETMNSWEPYQRDLQLTYMAERIRATPNASWLIEELHGDITRLRARKDGGI